MIVKSPFDPRMNICKRVIGLEGDKVCTSSPSDTFKTHTYVSISPSFGCIIVMFVWPCVFSCVVSMPHIVNLFYQHFFESILKVGFESPLSCRNDCYCFSLLFSLHCLQLALQFL